MNFNSIKTLNKKSRLLSEAEEIQKMSSYNVFVGNESNKNLNTQFFNHIKGFHKKQPLIDLEQTYKYSLIAFSFIEKILKQNQKILFVCTSYENRKYIRFVAEYMNQPFITKHWPGGLLTNIQYVQYKRNKATKKQEYNEWIQRPTAIFLFDETEGVIDEAKKLNIPVIALTGLNFKNLSVDYPIPANNSLTTSYIFFLEKLLMLSFKLKKI